MTNLELLRKAQSIAQLKADSYREIIDRGMVTGDIRTGDDPDSMEYRCTKVYDSNLKELGEFPNLAYADDFIDSIHLWQPLADEFRAALTEFSDLLSSSYEIQKNLEETYLHTLKKARSLVGDE